MVARCSRACYWLGERCPLLSYEHQMDWYTDFYLQLDSHTDFVRHWDTKMIKAWAKADNEFAVLTTYPPENGRHGKRGGMICSTQIMPVGKVQIVSKESVCVLLPYFVLSLQMLKHDALHEVGLHHLAM